MGIHLPSPRKGAQHPPLFSPCVLWPDGWMDQDTTWYGGRPRPKRHRVRWGPTSPPQKGTQQPPPLLGRCLLWTNSRPSQQLLSCCLPSQPAACPTHLSQLQRPFSAQTWLAGSPSVFFLDLFWKRILGISGTGFLQVWCPYWHPTNSVKALKET